MIDIEELENEIAHYLKQGTYVNLHESTQVALAQDLGPVLADFLHERGVSIDWSDGSRYGTQVAK